jgi:hypothetical protein
MVGSPPSPPFPVSHTYSELCSLKLTSYSRPDRRNIAYLRNCGVGAEYTEEVAFRVTDEHDARLVVKEAISPQCQYPENKVSIPRGRSSIVLPFRKPVPFLPQCLRVL